jgi:putative inorganic carbon (hco3(-)) transporter
VARVHEPQRVLTHGAGAAAPRMARIIADPRHVLLVLLVAGLAASITLSQTMLVVLTLWLLRERHRGRLQLAWPLGVPIMAFAGWTLLAALLSGAPTDSVRASHTLIGLATLWVVLHAVDDAPRARWFATALFIALAVVAALSIVQVSTCGGDRLTAKAAGLPRVLSSFFGKCHRAHGFYSIYMTLGGVLAMVLVLTLPRLTYLRHRAAAAAAWLVSALGFALTLVRGAWVGFGVAVVVLACTLRRQTTTFIGVLLVGAATLAIPGVLARALSFVDMTDPTARERVAMMSSGATLLREHPIAGIGPGQVKHLYPQYAPSYAVRRHTSHLHNTPLQIAVERGVIGLALWLWIFAAFFARLVKIWKRLPVDAGQDRALVAGCAAAIVAFLVGGLFEYNFGDTEVLLLATSIMALPLAIERERTRSAA